MLLVTSTTTTFVRPVVMPMIMSVFVSVIVSVTRCLLLPRLSGWTVGDPGSFRTFLATRAASLFAGTRPSKFISGGVGGALGSLGLDACTRFLGGSILRLVGGSILRFLRGSVLRLVGLTLHRGLDCAGQFHQGGGQWGGQ